MYKQVLKVALVSTTNGAVLFSTRVCRAFFIRRKCPRSGKFNLNGQRLYYMDEFLNVNYRELEALVEKANQVVAEHPQNAEALVWDAIVMSTMAEKKGGLGALSLVKKARLKLEEAEAIDPTVLGRSVYASPGERFTPRFLDGRLGLAAMKRRKNTSKKRLL